MGGVLAAVNGGQKNNPVGDSATIDRDGKSKLNKYLNI